jgi:hypothetical protein
MGASGEFIYFPLYKPLLIKHNVFVLCFFCDPFCVNCSSNFLQCLLPLWHKFFRLEATFIVQLTLAVLNHTSNNNPRYYTFLSSLYIHSSVINMYQGIHYGDKIKCKFCVNYVYDIAVDASEFSLTIHSECCGLP